MEEQGDSKSIRLTFKGKLPCQSQEQRCQQHRLQPNGCLYGQVSHACSVCVSIRVDVHVHKRDVPPETVAYCLALAQLFREPHKL